ncbi:MAG: hypothetical protein ACI8XM_000726 [Haloarculaceae archaeon]|jgi:hypothetical protein
MVTTTSLLRQAAELLAQLAGLVILAGTLAAIAAFLYRWYVRETVPRGLSLLVGLSGVAIYLNTTQALGQVIDGSSLPTDTEVALFNIVAFAIATGGAVLGRRAGDRFGSEVILQRGVEVERDVGRLVQSVGRVIRVELPEDIQDVVGYDPVPEETRETLAGKTFLFPKRLTVEELRDRLVSRLKADYAVGHVDVELSADGTVEYLALGSRAAGIGPTLPPETNAVAIRADPPFAASAGDLVQVWETDPMRRILTAELRGVADDTVTVAIDAADTPTLDPRTEYRLVTLPVEDRPDREFASLLRAADETFSSVTVEAGSPLHGLPVGALSVTVIAVKPEDDTPVTLPEATDVLVPGDVVFAIAPPEALRRLDGAAQPLEPTLVQHVAQSGAGSRPTEHAGQPSEDDTADDSDDDTADDSDDEPTDSTGEQDGEEPAIDGDQPDADAETDDEADPPATDQKPEGPSGQADASSFQQLKTEFESGSAEWAEEPPDSTGTESETAEAETEEGFDVDDEGDGLDIGDDDLSALAVEDDDDLGLEDDLTFEEDIDSSDADGDEGEDDSKSEDDNDDDSDDDDSDDDDSDDDDSDEDDDGGGGSKSFQQLKEEFESGEADWDDDISDSPGGDMRLDE